MFKFSKASAKCMFFESHKKCWGEVFLQSCILSCYDMKGRKILQCAMARQIRHTFAASSGVVTVFSAWWRILCCCSSCSLLTQATDTRLYSLHKLHVEAEIEETIELVRVSTHVAAQNHVTVLLKLEAVMPCTKTQAPKKHAAFQGKKKSQCALRKQNKGMHISGETFTLHRCGLLLK